MSTTTHTEPGPITADPQGTLATVVSEFLRTWSGALDALLPGEDIVEHLEGMNDAGLVRVLDELGSVNQVVEVLAARVMGQLSQRSRRVGAGEDDPVRSRGYANPAVMLSERWRVPRGRAATIVTVGEAITRRRALTGDVMPCDRPEIAAALEPRVLTSDDEVALWNPAFPDAPPPAFLPAPLSVDGAGIVLRELRLVSRGWDATRVDAAVAAGLEHCAHAPLAEVHSLAKLVRLSLDQDGPVPREEALRRQQRCTLRELPDGMFELRAFLAPEAAAWVVAGIDALVGKQIRQSRVRFPTAAEASSVGPSTDSSTDPSVDPFSDDYVDPAELPDTRTMEQRRVDALVDIFRHTGTCTDATTELAPVSVIVRMDLAELMDDSPWSSGTATIDGIQEPISAGTARRMAAEARIIPAVMGGPSQTLDLGVGTRLFSKAQKLALAERDGGCAWTGCTHPPSYTEAHHIRWWSRGGPTNLDNGILLCSFHHHRIHDDGWEISVRDGIPWFIPPAKVDLNRTPRRGGKPRLAA